MKWNYNVESNLEVDFDNPSQMSSLFQKLDHVLNSESNIR